MMKKSDLVKPKSLEDCGSHGYTDDEFEEYSEEEMLSEEEPNENLCMSPRKEGSCEELNRLEASSAEEPNEDSSSDEEPAEELPFGDESDDEDSCPEEPSEEDLIENPEAETAEYPTNEKTLEKASDEDPSDVSFEESVEEESSEESEEQPNEEEPLSGSIDQPPRLLEENKASDQIFSESKPSAESSFNHCQRESNNLSTDATVSRQPGDPSTSRKKRRGRWDMRAETPMLLNECVDQDKKRSRWSSDTEGGASIPENDNAVLNKSRTRWSNDKTQFNLSDTVKLSDSVKYILSNFHNDERLQSLNAMLQEIHQKLEGCAIINKPQKESSSSPQPIDVELNSNDARLLLLKKKNEIILELLRMIKNEDKPTKHRSTHSYKFCKKLYIPLKEYPNYNFVGLILGPSGNALKKMEAETGATILIRGKGSDLRLKSSSNDEELHVLIQSDNQICFDAAVRMVEELLVPVDEGHNYRKAAQLRELAELKRTLNVEKAWEMEPRVICAKSSHPTSACPLRATESKTNPNYLTGSGSLFSSFTSPSLSPPPLPTVANAQGDKPNEFDPTDLFVGRLPQSVTIDKLKELFLPYGTLCSATLQMDKSTGRSKGYGFVMYTNASDAANAIEKMNGYFIDGRKIVVRMSGTFAPFNANPPNNTGFVSSPSPSLISNLPKFSSLPSIPPFYNANLPNYQGIHPPSTSNVNLPNYLGLASIPLSSNANLPNYSELAAIPLTIPKPNSWPGPPGSMLPESGISFLENNYNSFTCTESVPLQSSTSLVSSFQTSLVKDGYMIDGKKLNVANLPTPPPLLSANLPNYPQFAAIPTKIPGSILPESRTSFPTNSYNSLKHTESVPSRSSTYLGSASQTSISSSQFHGVTAISNELASFPGYLKSIDPPNQLDQSIPSSSLSSQTAYFSGNFSGNHINPAWR